MHDSHYKKILSLDCRGERKKGKTCYLQSTQINDNELQKKRDDEKLDEIDKEDDFDVTTLHQRTMM